MQIMHKGILPMDDTGRVEIVIRERLRKARESAGLSQAEAASRLNKPQWFVSRSETGERRIDISELLEFGKAYKKSLRYFLGGFLDK